MIAYRKRGLKITEVWFDETIPKADTDVILFSQWSKPVSGALCRKKFTLVSDLTGDIETLFAALNKGTRNEIRRAQGKDGLLCECPSAKDEQVLRAFFEFFDRFAVQKGLKKLVRSRIALYATSGLLDVSLARDTQSEIIVWHAHLIACGRARLLYSASLFRESEDKQRRNLIGRANRYLLWEDMLRFRANGTFLYDLGGWYAGHSDRERQAINRFKEEFSKCKICEFDCELPMSLKGRVALWLYHQLKKRD